MRYGRTVCISDELIHSAADYLRNIYACRPHAALILGSGLGGLAERIRTAAHVACQHIPGIPPVSADGHSGTWVFGHWGDVPLVVLQGRSHLYEGCTPEQLMFPVRVLHALGVRYLVVTNAAGGLNEAFRPGDLMVIRDHISLQWINDVAWITRLMAQGARCGVVYDDQGREAVWAAAQTLGLRIMEGVYVGVLGPNYETRAEYRMLRRIGADAVGMSTLCETIAAAWLHMRSVGISVIANVAKPDRPDRLTHEEVLRAADQAQDRLAQLLEELLCRSNWVQP